MKNAKYYPFERNKYFYGKLLSVDDFELEQRYTNNKRRMTNRFLFGMGVVTGLYVVRVDEKTLSVEKGFAMDYSGREIVVDSPVIKKLSMLEGYQTSVEEGEKDYAYLCLEYDEKETGAVNNLAGNGNPGEEQVYNRISESYRLYLTEAEPESEMSDQENLYEQTRVLYQGYGVKIKQILPRYAVSGATTDIRFEIENTGRRYLSFAMNMEFEGLNYGGQRSLAVSFNETQYEKTGHYDFTYTLSVADASDLMAKVTTLCNDMKIYIDQNPVKTEAEDRDDFVNVSRESVRDQLVNRYFHLPMDSIVPANQITRLYLAKVYLVHVGDSSMIEKIENLPFNQCVWSTNLSTAVQMLTNQVKYVKSRNAIKGGNVAGSKNAKEETGMRIAQGTYTLDLNGGGQKGTRYVGEEVAHGLGLGRCSIQVGLEDDKGVITYGSSEVFEDTKPMIELAVKVFPDRGTFQVGGRLFQQVTKNQVTIHWTAIMNEEEYIEDRITRKIFIKPSVLELATRETHYLEAVCTNMDDKEIKWSVKNMGGTISENGMYTAPNDPGVYEVVAQSVAYPDVKASIFVVVRQA